MCQCTPEIRTPFCGKPGCRMPAQSTAAVLRKREDILDKLRDLHMQATVERSHFYVGGCVTEAIQEISAMRQFLRGLQGAIEAEGYAIMVGVDGGFVEIVNRDES